MSDPRVRTRIARALCAGLVALLGLTACGLHSPSNDVVSYGDAVARPPIRLKGAGGPRRLDSRRPQQVTLPQPSALPSLDRLGFHWPVGDASRITSPFGWRTDPISRSQRFHHGVDIACWAGEAIGATARGTVIWAGRARVYGNAVVLAHAYGLLTINAHLRDITVQIGQRVRTGTQIGTCGSSGRSTGPHLHLEVRHGSNVYDPVRFLP